jgi:hypothetical protein
MNKKISKGYDLCKACESGYYAAWFGLRYCFICPERYYCPTTSGAPKMCPAGSICPEGSTADIPCVPPFYYVKNLDDKSCTLTFQFYLLICGSVFAIAALIVIAFVSIKRHKNSSQKRDEKKRILLDSKDPEYNGY